MKAIAVNIGLGIFGKFLMHHAAHFRAFEVDAMAYPRRMVAHKFEKFPWKLLVLYFHVSVKIVILFLWSFGASAL